MKKLIAVLLCMVLFLPIFSACGKSNEPVTLTVMVEEGTFHEERREEMQDALDLLYGNITLEFVEVESDELEREMSLSNIRTEIMSGKGPDIFILPTWDTRVNIQYSETQQKYIFSRKEPVFKDMTDAMNNRTFLELDKYIAESKYMSMDEFPSIIMDEGKVNGKQVVLPLFYNYDIVFLDRSLMEDPELKISSFEEAVSTGDKNISASLSNSSVMISESLFADMVSPDGQTLLVEEEDIADSLKLLGKIYDVTDGEDIRAADKGPYSLNSFGKGALYAWKLHGENAYPLYIHNNAGGLTATISDFVAINGSTKHPDEAFKMVELIFSEEIQSGVGFESNELNKFGNPRYYGSMFIYDGYSGNLPTSKAAYNEEILYDYSLLEGLLEKTNSVRFVSEYDCMIADAWNNIELEYFYGPLKETEDYNELVDEVAAELYSDFKMMAAE